MHLKTATNAVNLQLDQVKECSLYGLYHGRKSILIIVAIRIMISCDPETEQEGKWERGGRGESKNELSDF